MCLWLCIVWFLGVAQAGDVTLWYSTNLETLPTVLVEYQGTQNQWFQNATVWKVTYTFGPSYGRNNLLG